jgi:hypothetical protein
MKAYLLKKIPIFIFTILFLAMSTPMVSAENEFITGSFNEGLLRLVINGKYGFADSSGKLVIKPIYDGAYDFKNGYTIVNKRGQWIPINKDGKELREDNDFIYLKARHFVKVTDKGENDSELDSKHYPVKFPFMPGKTALVIIDAWEHHANEGLQRRMKNNMRNNLLPLLTLARRNKLLVIHASHEREIAKIVKPIPGEFVIDSSGDKAADEMTAILDKNNINTLLYAGYVVNICVLDRKTGIKNMASRGYKIVLVRDATIAFEDADTLAGEWIKKISVTSIELNYGFSSTLNDLKNVFRH